MPIVNITVIEGRDGKVIEDCLKNVAKTVAESLDAPLDSVHVSINEVAPNRYARGDKLISEK